MKRYLIALACIPILAACNLGDKMKDILALSAEVKEKYHCEEAGITLNNGSEIKITLENSPYNDSSDEVKQRVSDEIGVMVMAHPQTGKGLKEGYTVFSSKTGNSIASVSSTSSFSMHLAEVK